MAYFLFSLLFSMWGALRAVPRLPVVVSPAGVLEDEGPAGAGTAARSEVELAVLIVGGGRWEKRNNVWIFFTQVQLTTLY